MTIKHNRLNDEYDLFHIGKKDKGTYMCIIYVLGSGFRAKTKVVKGLFTHFFFFLVIHFYNALLI